MLNITIDGKTYRLVAEERFKKDALERAKRIRNNGYNARVIKQSVGLFKYKVYTSKLKRKY